jgi:predicted CXXCH cytochrome family protein
MPVKSPALTVVAVVATLVIGVHAFAATAAPPAAEVDCSKCHAKLTVKKKTVHAAVQMGCPSCHSGITNALKVPHVKSGTSAKGLGSEQPDLCYGCHDKTKFTKKTVHAAINMGCTGCHDPHANNNEKLLAAAVPDLCFGCHDKGEFTRKNVHAAVQMGCLTCHDPHSTDDPGLLTKSAYDLCLGCHDQVNKKPHAISGFGKSGHPLGGTKKKSGKRPVKDPKREGRIFSCASCHNPHSSDTIKLFRYPARSSMELCSHCHKM